MVVRRDDGDKTKKKSKEHKGKKHKKRSQSSSRESSEESAEEGIQELQSIFGLPNKEYQRNPKQARAEDLSAKQTAVAITNITSCVTSDDIMEIGGDAESLLSQNRDRFKKSKNKDGEHAAVNKARAASVRWKKRLGKLIQVSCLFRTMTNPVCGKSPSGINIMNAKTMEDVSILLRSLSASHRKLPG
ncbi:unnamed protein product [Symbiodinium sp. CCMP2592]|nr:unnamed protein product [Symbiodinium sp. CCMP2592]